MFVSLSVPNRRKLLVYCFQTINGGETGIRTLGAREGTTVFETAPFDHSGTSPPISEKIALNRASYNDLELYEQVFSRQSLL